MRLVGLEPTCQKATDFKSGVYTDSTTIAKDGQDDRTRTYNIDAPNVALYQIELHPDVYIILYIVAKVKFGGTTWT